MSFERNICSTQHCRQVACITCRDVASGTREKNQHFCLVHFYGSKFALPKLEDHVFVTNNEVYKQQILSSRSVVKRVLNGIEDDIFWYSDKIKKKAKTSVAARAEIIRASSEPKPRSKLQPDQPLKENTDSEEKESPNLGDKSRKGSKQRMQIWKTSSPNPTPARSDVKTSTKISSSVASSGKNLQMKAVVGSEFDGMNFSGAIEKPKNKHRHKSAVMLRESIRTNLKTRKNLWELSRISLSIENRLFKMFPFVEGSSMNEENKENKKRYFERVRLLFTNIRDERNEDLRLRIISGKITIEELCSANAAELLNPESKEYREKSQNRLIQRNTISSAEALGAGIKVDNFQCPSCSNLEGNTMLNVSTSRDVGKCETWGNKDTMDSKSMRIICGKCEHEFFR